MGRSTTKIIVVLAAVFVVIAVFQARKAGDPPAGVTGVETLFPGLDLAAVAAVEIRRGEESITLSRTGEDLWGVDPRDGYPVDGEKLRRLALTIAGLQARDRLTDNPEKYAAVGLDDPPEGGTIHLRDEAGNNLVVLQLGNRKQPKGSGGSTGQFVRVGGDPAVYLVAGAPTVDTAATGWIDRKLLDLAADKIMAVAVERAEGAFTAARKQPSDPLTLVTALPAGRTADSGALGDLGRALVGVNGDDVLGADDETTRALEFGAVFAAETADRVRYKVALAKQDEKHFVRLAAEALPAPKAGETEAGGDGGEASPGEETDDPAATVAAFNSRHEGWTYPIPKYVFDRLDKSLDDLLAKENPE